MRNSNKICILNDMVAVDDFGPYKFKENIIKVLVSMLVISLWNH